MSTSSRWLGRLIGRETTPQPRPLTREHVIWAYRLLLDREAESEYVIETKVRGLSSTQELRAALVASPEYQEKNRDFAQTNERNLVIKEFDGVRLVVDLSDHAIGLNIIRGRFEQNELAFARSVLRAGDHALDCGAHIGLFAMHMASWVGSNGSVVAFEPFADNAECLALAIRENRFEDRVVLERAAVGDHDGTLNLVFATDALNTGGAFIQTEGLELPPHHTTAPVRLMALDGYALRRPVRFMKIDVEGAEPLVMKGAQGMLRDDRPVMPVGVASEATPDCFGWKRGGVPRSNAWPRLPLRHARGRGQAGRRASCRTRTQK